MKRRTWTAILGVLVMVALVVPVAFAAQGDAGMGKDNDGSQMMDSGNTEETADTPDAGNMMDEPADTNDSQNADTGDMMDEPGDMNDSQDMDNGPNPSPDTRNNNPFPDVPQNYYPPFDEKAFSQDDWLQYWQDHYRYMGGMMGGMMGGYGYGNGNGGYGYGMMGGYGNGNYGYGMMGGYGYGMMGGYGYGYNQSNN